MVHDPADQTEDATHVFKSGDEALSDEWAINVSDDDTRKLRAVEIAAGVLNGTLDPHDVFAWRDGMADWVPVAQCEPLMRLVEQIRTNSKARAQATAGTGRKRRDSAKTALMADPPRGTGGRLNPNEISRTLASPVTLQQEFNQKDEPDDAEEPDETLALVDGSLKPQREASNRPPPLRTRLVGERGEESLLFSPEMAMAALRGTPMASRDERGGISSMGASGGIAAALAAPMIAPSHPSSGAHPSTHTSQAVLAAPPVIPVLASPTFGTNQQGTGKNTLLIAAVAAGALLVMAVVLVIALAGDDAESPSAASGNDPSGAASSAFDYDSATAVLDAASKQAANCGSEGGPAGQGKVSVTFSPDGRATLATVGSPFAGTPSGGCVTAAFKRTRVPAFLGDSITVSKSFSVKSR